MTKKKRIWHSSMEEEIFKTKPSAIEALKFWIIRIAAVVAIIFSFYTFNENPFFFSTLIISGAMVLLLCGSKQITIYKTYVNVHTDSLLKNSLFSRKFLLKEIREISAEIPHEITEMILSKEYPLSSRYRLVIIPQDDIQRTYWMMTTPEDLQKAIRMINEMIGNNNQSFLRQL